MKDIKDYSLLQHNTFGMEARCSRFLEYESTEDACLVAAILRTAGQPFIIQPDGSTVKTTEMLALNIYNTFYGSNSASQGVAQAKAVLFFILVAGLGLAQLGYTRRREVQQ